MAMSNARPKDTSIVLTRALRTNRLDKPILSRLNEYDELNNIM